MRSIVSTLNGGRPVLAFGQCGSTICTSTAHGTTRSISSKNSRLRVFFVERFRPSPSCFMLAIVAPAVTSGKTGQHGVMQTILRSPLQAFPCYAVHTGCREGCSHGNDRGGAEVS